MVLDHEKLSALKLMKLVRKINKGFDTNEVLITEYAFSLDAWIDTLKHLGSAIAVAFNDTREKAQQMRDN